MIICAILTFLALTTLVAGVFPWLISLISTHEIFLSGYGFILLLPGIGMLIVSVVSFSRRNPVTLAPWEQVE